MDSEEQFSKIIRKKKRNNSDDTNIKTDEVTEEKISDNITDDIESNTEFKEVYNKEKVDSKNYKNIVIVCLILVLVVGVFYFLKSNGNSGSATKSFVMIEKGNEVVLDDRVLKILGYYKNSKMTEDYSFYNILQKSGNANVTSIDIPETFEYNGKRYKIIGIGEDVFQNCTSLENVKLPNTIKSIGFSAFENCSSLKNVNIPSSLKDIALNAFEECNSLKINIPNNVNYTIGFNDDVLKTLGYEKEKKDIGYVLKKDGNIINSLDIPEYCDYKGKKCKIIRIENLYESGVGGCVSLKKVKLPKTVNEIAFAAFNSWRDLETINIPNSVTKIGEQAFAYCTSLKSIDLPKNLTEVNYNVFYRCDSLKLPNNRIYNRTLDDDTKKELIELGYIKTSSESNGTPVSIDIPDVYTYKELKFQITKIDELSGVFKSSEYLEKVKLPNSLQSIGNDTFCACPKLKEIIFPENLEEIEDGAFALCTSLESVNLPNSILSIGNHAFGLCTSLKNINIPKYLLEIEGATFRGCTSLENVNLPQNLVKINDGGTFLGCSSLNNITIPDGVVEIGDRDSFGYDPVFDDNTTVTYHGKATGAPWGAGEVIGVDYERNKSSNDIFSTNSRLNLDDDPSLIYLSGVLKLDEDDDEALRLIKKSAEMGYEKAQLELGFIYFQGRITGTDTEKSDYWFRKARDWAKKSAEEGDDDAQFFLGIMYIIGLGGVDVDVDEGKYWLKKSANQGNSRASSLLEAIEL